MMVLVLDLGFIVAWEEGFETSGLWGCNIWENIVFFVEKKGNVCTLAHFEIPITIYEHMSVNLSTMILFRFYV